jgi:shikimate dehydrogenase
VTSKLEPRTSNAVVGLIGHPVGHSISPVFQQAGFDALGLDIRYEAWETAGEALAGRVASLREDERIGANVTVPYKEAVLELLDVLTEEALRTGAVNTIARGDGGRLVGHNTDIAGFDEALRRDGGFDPSGARVCVLGAGGAARAAIVALVDGGAAEIALWNRTPERAHALAGALDRRDGRLRVVGDDVGEAAAEAGLIVNCTTLGMAGGAGAGLSPLLEPEIPTGAFVFDIVANPAETPLMAAARSRGCATLGGLSMLVRQGARAFTLWTGREAPLEVMFAAARRAMGFSA